MSRRFTSMTSRQSLLIAIASCLLLPSLARAQDGDNLRIRVKEGKLLFRKVILTDDAVVYKKPGEGQIGTVEAFSFYYLLWPDKNTKDKDHLEHNGKKWIHVGGSDGTTKGWIQKDYVVEWNTRFVLDPKFEAENSPRNFKAWLTKDKSVTLQMLAPGPQHKRVAPILAVAEDSKEDNPLFEIALFAGKVTTQREPTLSKTDPKPTDQAKKREEVVSNLKLEIVYVIDSTGSMTPLIEGTKDVIRISAEQLSKVPALKGAVRFGLVTYQDNTVGLTATRMVSKLTDNMVEFTKAVQSVSAAKIGSEETQEDVLAGLKMAIEESGWEKMSMKHIILLGDASAHLGGFKNTKGEEKNTTGLDIQRIIDRARPQAGTELNKELNMKNLSAIRALNPADPEDEKRCAQQFKEISENHKEFAGLFREIDPNSKTAIDQLVSELTKDLGETYEKLVQVRQGGAQPIVVTPQSAAQTNNPFLTSYYKIMGSIPANIDPNRSVLLGYATVKGDDNREIAVRKTILYMQDVVRLHSSLDSIYTSFRSVSPGDRASVDSTLRSRA